MEKILSLFETYPLEYDFSQIILILFLTAFFLSVIYFFIKVPLYLKPLKNIKKTEKPFQLNLSNSKETAYRVTFLIHKYSTPYNEELLKRLEKFKYKKDVDELDKDTIDLISKFMEYVRKNNGGI
ncbi:hypothetical protein [Persephonella hydrogeniphila]|nr:hypothetical protein [Persephonella hydrogeniphila]